MRIVNFALNGSARLGVDLGEKIVDLSQAAPDLPRDLVDLLEAGEPALSRAREVSKSAKATVPWSEAKLLMPTRRSGKMLCLGLNYRGHAIETGNPIPPYPVVFLRTATSLVAGGEPIVRPTCSEQFDWEAEIVAVIGKRTRHATAQNALQAVAGYTACNEGSVRNYQKKSSQWTVGKNFDRSGSLGPAFVTADELPPGGDNLRVQTRLNGVSMQDGNTSDMIFKVADVIVLLSECMTLEPGDMLIMGTPGGVGAGRKPQLWMKPGDVCEVEVEGIGVLRNPVIDEASA